MALKLSKLSDILRLSRTPHHVRHSGESGNRAQRSCWVPAFAGMTVRGVANGVGE
jgi:hypothetical protein